jgi:hypothetical protein
MQIHESELPSIGRKFQMTTESGDKLVIVVNPGGGSAKPVFAVRRPQAGGNGSPGRLELVSFSEGRVSKGRERDELRG